MNSSIAFVGGGPAALVGAIALARRGIRTTVFERDPHPEVALRFNPDRSYAIDISGHGLKALQHIDACESFDQRMFQFKGIKLLNGEVEEWKLPGWTGSRGDILRSLMAIIETNYPALITFKPDCHVNSIDVGAGSLTYQSNSSDLSTAQFDLIIGADGAGSIVRKAMQKQVPGFTVTTKSFPNYATMIELDQVGDRLDHNYLYLLGLTPFCVAGAIKPDQGNIPRWFCAIGTKVQHSYSSTEAANQYLSNHVPPILQLTSEQKIAEFAQRTCYHIGQSLNCSQLYGGKAILLGDAAAAFPPIGQGVNAAMESAMVLDLCIGEMGDSPTQLIEAARLYHTKWKPEADAVSWIGEKLLYENRLHILRGILTMKLGLNVLSQAKNADIPYSEVKRRAERLNPLWL